MQKMIDMEKVIGIIDELIFEAQKELTWKAENALRCLKKELLKEQEVKQSNNHEVACIIADLFGDPCACNFNNIDEWLPYKCDFRETCCPNPVGVACLEQYLKHKESR